MLFITGRVEELELEASNLKADLCMSDKKIWDRERKWVEKVEILQDQLSLKSEDVLTQHSLKIEVEGLQKEKSELIQSLNEKSEEIEKSENAFRSEVTGTVSEITCSTSLNGSVNSKNGGKNSGLIRYRSLRDHNGRYYLVVKIH